LSARQAGWLSATVEHKDGRPAKTRLAEIVERGGTPPFVEVTSGKYLVEALQDLGTFDDTEDGPKAISWTEILAFSRATLVVTEPWELQLIRDMSKAFVMGIREGKDPFGIPPTER